MLLIIVSNHRYNFVSRVYVFMGQSQFQSSNGSLLSHMVTCNLFVKSCNSKFPPQDFIQSLL